MLSSGTATAGYEHMQIGAGLAALVTALASRLAGIPESRWARRSKGLTWVSSQGRGKRAEESERQTRDASRR